MGKKDQQTNHRARRARHVELATAIRKRKRVRRERAEIHAAMEQARNVVALYGLEDDLRPYRALDSRSTDGYGWMYENRLGVVFFESSRDKAREAVKRLNAVEPPTVESEMQRLGFWRVADSGSVEEKYQRTS